MFCNKCGNEIEFRVNRYMKTIACKNIACNNLIRTRHNFDFRGVDEVQWFAHHMLQKLNNQKNQVKPGWDCAAIGHLILDLKAEIKELEIEIERQVKNKISDPNAILSECCDVANFAMMIADNTCITKHRSYMGD